jgi:hypothetical protein
MHLYQSQAEPVLPLLPDEVAKEDCHEIVIGTDKAAKKSHELSLGGYYQYRKGYHIYFMVE